MPFSKLLREKEDHEEDEEDVRIEMKKFAFSRKLRMSLSMLR